MAGLVKKLKAVTLIELIVAMSLLTLILLAGGGIYLSGWNIFRDSQYDTQSQRNAMIPMMHMIKNLQTVSSYTLESVTELRFTVNPLGQTPADIRRYIFQNDQIQYDTDISDGGEQIIGTHIPAGQNTNPFDASTHPNMVTISITARDNQDTSGSDYTITTNVEARYGPAQIL